jgi:uncharacterized membrane protein YdfJ with MMPL/SSD domain
MHRLMLRLDSLVKRRRRALLVLWVAVLVAALPLTAKQGDNLKGGGFTVAGSDSLAVEQELARDYPGYERSPLSVVLEPTAGASAADMRAARAEVVRAVGAQPGVRLARADGPTPRGDRPLLVPLRTGVGDDATVDIGRDLGERLGVHSEQTGPVRPHLVGYGAVWSGLGEVSKKDLAAAEAIGFPIIAIILLAVFGSLVAAALPLALGFVSVAITGALIYALSLVTDMSIFVTNMASMIGIGVAVDYSLFVLARYREEVRAGQELDEARRIAMGSSGVAVLFSGVTVVISLAGLWTIPNSAIRSMAVGAILVVAVSMLASATLLPALMRTMGRRAVEPGRMVAALGRLRRRGATARPAPEGFWHRWTRAVMRRPVLSVLAAGGLLLVLAIPTLSLQTGIGAVNQVPDDSELARAIDVAAKVAPPGSAGPVHVVVEPRSGALDRSGLAELRREIARDPAVLSVQPPRVARDGRSALIVAVPDADPEADRTRALVRRLRADLPTAAGPATAATVGGGTAALEDIDGMLDRSMWKLLVFVLGLSFLVLLVLLRSVLLPLKAVVMNLLSVGAAYGVVVAVFQYGWIDGFLGFESPGYVDWMTPPLVLAVVFGLSMDYEVFLLSRIKERYDATGDTTRAVAEGLASSARTITSAALIMVSVFLVFVGTGVSSVQQLGVGNAVAIAVDATIVRLVLMPAAMRLLGRWNWWLPRPLARWLPEVGIERTPEPALAIESSR